MFPSPEGFLVSFSVPTVLLSSFQDVHIRFQNVPPIVGTNKYQFFARKFDPQLLNGANRYPKYVRRCACYPIQEASH
jgi:hypothetical protein